MPKKFAWLEVLDITMNATELDQIDWEWFGCLIKKESLGMKGGGIFISFGFGQPIRIQLVEPLLHKMKKGDRVGFDFGTGTFTIGKK